MKKTSFIIFIAFHCGAVQAQQLTLSNVIDSIEAHHPIVKMYDNEIRSMDEAAKGARSWMPPTVGIGQFMTPYNVSRWKGKEGMEAMGSVMVSVEQMFPQKGKLDAGEAYMKVMSSVEQENKAAGINELVQEAKALYYEWIVLRKRLAVVDENEQMLEFMIKNAEIRYRNGAGKISAYYKAKAALGYTKNMRLMDESGIREKRIRLNALMGRSALTPFEIDTAFAFSDYSAMVFDSGLFYRTRSDMKSLDQQIALTQLKRNIERQNLRPEFGVRLDNMYEFSGQLRYTVMAMARLPFVSWASKMNRAAAESLKWKADALQAQKEMMASEYSGMAYGMRTEYQLLQRQLELYRVDIIPALKNNFRAMQSAYEQNTEELFMLYDAWEKLNMTQLEYCDILAKALKQQTTIDRLIQKR
ncbi:MAG: TolC family protein [Chitinophagaceae bacterium]|nr:TolC family protein [Chitinophagaceae bacterium]